MFQVKDWAEVHRLFHRDRWSKMAIAEHLQMNRMTVDRLLALDQPTSYQRATKGSALDEFEGAIMAMLEENVRAPATVILERLRPLGYKGGITVLKERVAKLREPLLAAKSYQRTTYLPGEISQRRKMVLGLAYLSHPERFVNKAPTPPSLPEVVWINQPAEELTPIQ